MQHTGNNDIILRGIHTGQAEDNVALTAHVLLGGHSAAKLERLVAELSLQPGIYAVHWYAGDQSSPILPAGQPD